MDSGNRAKSSAIGPFTQRLMAYICEKGFCDAATRDKDWIAYGDALLTGQEPVEGYGRLARVVEEFTRSKTKAELLQAALERKLLIAPITTINEVVYGDHLASRGYWRPLEHSELGQAFRYPGPFARFSATPIVDRRRPPLVGEHNREIYIDELGFTAQQLAQLQAEGVI
jgi:crotonobetainyl-CoA:carnitine CoA-transferase CaiB-like acyl-CoA transferase